MFIFFIHTLLTYTFHSHLRHVLFAHHLAQGIHFLEVVSELFFDETVEIKQFVGVKIGLWLKFLLKQINITGFNPAIHFEHFIKGKEKILVQYRFMVQEYVSGLLMKLDDCRLIKSVVSLHNVFQHTYLSVPICPNSLMLVQCV